MPLSRPLLAAVLVMTAARVSFAAGPPATLADPDDAGPNRPPLGQSMFDELYLDGRGDHDLPFPFEALLADLEARVAPGDVTAILIPLGRSLQRHAAWPDYFDAARVVVGVTADPGAPGRPFLQDRLYLGYHESAAVIEAISWNEAAGRFEFQVIEDYGPGGSARVEDGERSVCVTCHQSQSPIFATALWSETNANMAVAALLAPLGERYHGVPVRGSVDHADALDRSTDRAFRLPFTDWLWRQACGDDEAGIHCRRILLEEALAFRLRGGRLRDRVSPAMTEVAGRLDDRLRQFAPGGVGAANPDLPNRDPLRLIADGADPFHAVEPEGMFDPSLPRAPVALWAPDTPPSELLDMAVGDIAAAFADEDVRRLDRVLRARTSSGAERRVVLPCALSQAAGPAGREELRFECTQRGDDGRATIAGFAQVDGGPVTGGRIRTLDLGTYGRAPALTVTGGRMGEARLALEVAEVGLGLAPRLTGGMRVVSLTIEMASESKVMVELSPDLAPLEAALRTMAEATAGDPEKALSSRPLRRRAILAELEATLGAAP